MRFYGVQSEDKVLEIVGNINGGEWVFEDTKEKRKEILSPEKVRERLRSMVEEIRRWKEEFVTLGGSTIFVFVHHPENPQAFKIYDPSSLGCSTELTPPRWKVYLKDLEGKV